MFKTIHDKINYDLALTYAKIKLEEAISNNQFDDTLAPIDVQQIELLQEEFIYAWDYYSNIYGKEE
jgi:hypothetical protein